MDYLEINLEINPKEEGSEVMIASLSEIGFESFIETKNGIKAYVVAQQFQSDLFAEVISDFSKLFEIKISQTLIPKQNWNKEWESSFQPIEIDNSCYVRAPFHEAKTGFTHDIIIEPKMSFGTGHHDTTQLMLKKMSTLTMLNKEVLDMGSGTGVLAIYASKLGAKNVWAVDIDEWSYENAIENTEKNRAQNVVVKNGGVEIIKGQHFFIILANINKNVLLSDMPLYMAALDKEGVLLLSGFFETDINEIKVAAETIGLKYIESSVQNGWAIIHLIK